MITASKQIDRVANSLTHLVRSRVVSARAIKPLVLRLDRVANTLEQGDVEEKKYRKRHRRVQESLNEFRQSWIDATDYFRKHGKTEETLTAEDVAAYFGLRVEHVSSILRRIQGMLKDFGPFKP